MSETDENRNIFEGGYNPEKLKKKKISLEAEIENETPPSNRLS